MVPKWDPKDREKRIKKQRKRVGQCGGRQK